jgi:hypothetical protein
MYPSRVKQAPRIGQTMTHRPQPIDSTRQPWLTNEHQAPSLTAAKASHFGWQWLAGVHTGARRRQWPQFLRERIGVRRRVPRLFDAERLAPAVYALQADNPSGCAIDDRPCSTAASGAFRDMSTRLTNSGCRTSTSIAMRGQRDDDQHGHMSASGAGYACIYRGGKPVLTNAAKPPACRP